MKKTSLLCWLFISAWCLLSFHGAVFAGETEYVRVADALYPQSRTWLEIERTPVLPSSHFQQVKHSLQQSYRAALSASDPFESGDCSFIQRALESSEIKSFHLVDIDHDGVPDIVYVGSAQCAEGGATAIWYGTKNGFVMRSPAHFPVRLLRVSSNGAQTISVSEGCCGDPVDKYHTGSLSNLREGDTVPFLHDTVLPKQSLDRPLQFVAKRELKLRASPKLKDEYDKGLSEFLNRAAFGNVLRHYMKQSKGVALASELVDGKKWYFVLMAAESNVLVSHDPYWGVRAGWVLESDVLVK